MIKNRLVILFFGTLLASFVIVTIISHENKSKNNIQIASANQNTNTDERVETKSPTLEPTGLQTNCSQKKCVALTFDDGPGKYSNELLDILKQNNAKASFFYIGRNISRHEDIVRRTYADGHDVGNHTWDHVNLNKISDHELQGQINDTSDAIARIIGKKPILLRPPFGSFSSSKLPLIDKMSIVQWDIDPDDWKTKDPNTIYDQVMQQAKDGDIVISHEIYQATIDAYRRIVPDLVNRGYSLVTITDMFDIDASNPPLRVFYSMRKIQ